jgi:DNA-binding response OmpR family regulator
MIAMFLADLLETMGHEVCACVETEMATVAAAARWTPDLLIVDANLREGSGVAAVAEILRTGFVPHVFVTGDVYRLGAEPGAVVMQKPFSPDRLVRAIDRALAAVAPS